MLYQDTNSTWPIDETLTASTTPGQSGRVSYVKERVIHIH